VRLEHEGGLSVTRRLTLPVRPSEPRLAQSSAWRATAAGST
jgi:hypothetical protein